jgi:hypothetical protein
MHLGVSTFAYADGPGYSTLLPLPGCANANHNHYSKVGDTIAQLSKDGVATIRRVEAIDGEIPCATNAGFLAMHSVFGRGEWKLHEREFEAFDELSHERKVKSIDRIAGKVVVRIPEKRRVRDHQCRQPGIPE